MSNLKKILISLGGLFTVIGFDIWLAITKRLTITNFVKKHTTLFHWASFLAGFLMCHFFGSF